MSVNPDDMSMAKGVATEYVDLEHQVIRQKLDVDSSDFAGEVLPGNPAAEFDPGERSLDREEVAQLVAYRRYASVNFLQPGDLANGQDNFAIIDASVGINGDLFRPVTTQESFVLDTQNLFVDSGGEIGLIDNYTLYATPSSNVTAGGTTLPGNGAVAQKSELFIDFYNWPTGGPIVDSFDTITCGFGAGVQTSASPEVQFELRYDFWWDVAEQGRSTNPFGRPSTR